jgi:hypothetical protein
MKEKIKIAIESSSGDYDREKVFKKIVMMNETDFLLFVNMISVYLVEKKIEDYKKPEQIK